MTDARPIAIDIVSDVVCPWCFIGKRRLEAALAQVPEIWTETTWRPYQLDPTIPPEGLSRHDYLMRKFGDPERIRAMHENITRTGAEVGIAFDFDRVTRAPNTLDAHRLIRWAGEAGEQEAVVEALFSANFLHGRDIGDRETLAAIAAEAGLDVSQVAADLAGPRDRDSITAEIDEARRIGVTGVPCFIIDRRYAISGAQPSETIAAAIRQAADEAGAGRHAVA